LVLQYLLASLTRITMSDTIKTFLDDGKLKTSLLTVKLIKEVSSNSYIIADKSMVAILDTHAAPDHAKHLNTGNWYKLIKCNKGEKSTINVNKLFKPVKTLFKDEIGDIADKVENLENTLETTASTKRYEDFQTISHKPNHTKIDRLTVKVITMSRVITTSKGNYKICNIKDVNGDKASINLYGKYIDSLELFKIFTITNTRKGEVTKDDETKMRLHTTGFTKVEHGTLEDSINFKEVGNADQSITGEVIGFGDLAIYNSCKLHYKKLDENNNCPRCNKDLKDDEILEDFRTEIYIEAKRSDITDEESEVKQILAFKKALNIKPDDNIEEKLDEMTGKTLTIDFNSDDAERFIAVSIQLSK
jgi:hypothetical protein